MSSTPRRLASLLASSALGGAALLAWAGPLAAAPAWTPVHDVSGPLGAAGEPGALLFSPQSPLQGHAATSAWAAWESAGIVRAAERPAALGAWAPAVPISDTGASGLEVAPNVAVWQRDVGANTRVEAAIRMQGTWTQPESLSLPGADATEPSVAGIGVGGMHAAGWLSADDGGDAVVQASVGSWLFGGGWGDPATLSDPSADASAVQVAGRGSGAIAVWRSQEGGESRIRTSLFSRDTGTWSASIAISPAGQVASEPRVATTAQGLAVVVWVAGSGSAATIQAAALPDASTEWTESVAISGSGASAPAIAVAQGVGNPAVQGGVAAWQRADGSEQIVEAAVRAGDTGAWSSAVRLSAEEQDAEAPAVAAGTATFYAAWRRPEDGGGAAVMAATRPSGPGLWTAAQEIAPPGGAVEGLGLAEGNGEALAHWRRAGGPVQGAAYDTLGPDYTDLEVPTFVYPTEAVERSNPPLGRVVRFSLKPFDTWSQVAGVAWDFGDGATGTGASVEHAFATPGLFRARVSLTDVLGNRTDVGDIEVRPKGPDPVPTPVPDRGQGHCAEAPAPEPSDGRSGGPVMLSLPQLLINQRIAQAAVRRANAIERWLADGIATRDICGWAFGRLAFGPGVHLGVAGPTDDPDRPNPRPLRLAPAPKGDPAAVRLSAAQLAVSQRISQAALRRLDALEARLDAGLSGGDLRDGAVTPQKLALGLRIAGVTPPAAPPAPTVTPPVAPGRRGEPGRVELTVAQLRINQRIAQAAVRRANALGSRLMTGLDQADFRPRTITAAKLHSTLRG